MGKLIKIFIIVFFCFFSISCGVKTWEKDLPNNYQIRLNKKLNVEVGYVENDKFYINYNDKKVGVDNYVAEYQTSVNFIGLKCVVKGTLEVIYYLIDTKEQNVYGPYKELDTYLEVQSKITNNEIFDKFISTSEIKR